eukprot:scaffold14.g1067.t1
MAEALQLSSKKLVFQHFELGLLCRTELSLQNPTDKRVAFKVKTTAPKAYSVKPATGVIEPRASVALAVSMVAQATMPPRLADCKDRFLIEALTVGADCREVDGALMEAHRSAVSSTKLKVVLVPKTKPSPGAAAAHAAALPCATAPAAPPLPRQSSPAEQQQGAPAAVHKYSKALQSQILKQQQAAAGAGGGAQARPQPPQQQPRRASGGEDQDGPVGRRVCRPVGGELLQGVVEAYDADAARYLVRWSCNQSREAFTRDQLSPLLEPAVLPQQGGSSQLQQPPTRTPVAAHQPALLFPKQQAASHAGGGRDSAKQSAAAQPANRASGPPPAQQATPAAPGKAPGGPQARGSPAEAEGPGQREQRPQQAARREQSIEVVVIDDDSEEEVVEERSKPALAKRDPAVPAPRVAAGVAAGRRASRGSRGSRQRQEESDSEYEPSEAELEAAERRETRWWKREAPSTSPQGTGTEEAEEEEEEERGGSARSGPSSGTRRRRGASVGAARRAAVRQSAAAAAARAQEGSEAEEEAEAMEVDGDSQPAADAEVAAPAAQLRTKSSLLQQRGVAAPPALILRLCDGGSGRELMVARVAPGTPLASVLAQLVKCCVVHGQTCAAEEMLSLQAAERRLLPRQTVRQAGLRDGDVVQDFSIAAKLSSNASSASGAVGGAISFAGLPSRVQARIVPRRDREEGGWVTPTDSKVLWKHSSCSTGSGKKLDCYATDACACKCVSDPKCQAFTFQPEFSKSKRDHNCFLFYVAPNKLALCPSLYGGVSAEFDT